MSNDDFEEDDNSFVDTMQYDDGYAEIDSECFLDEEELFQGHLGALGKQLLEKSKQGKISKEDFLAIKQSIFDSVVRKEEAILAGALAGKMPNMPSYLNSLKEDLFDYSKDPTPE